MLNKLITISSIHLITAFISWLYLNRGIKIHNNDNLFAFVAKHKKRQNRNFKFLRLEKKKLQRNFSSSGKKLHKIAENLRVVIKLLKVEKLCKFLRPSGEGSAECKQDAGFDLLRFLTLRDTIQLLNVFISATRADFMVYEVRTFKELVNERLSLLRGDKFNCNCAINAALNYAAFT